MSCACARWARAAAAGEPATSGSRSPPEGPTGSSRPSFTYIAAPWRMTKPTRALGLGSYDVPSAGHATRTTRKRTIATTADAVATRDRLRSARSNDEGQSTGPSPFRGESPQGVLAQPSARIEHQDLTRARVDPDDHFIM